MSTELDFPKDFKEVLRKKILDAYVDLIPKDKLDSLIDGEVKAFFETERFLTVDQTRITVSNPAYEPERGYGYNNDKTLTKDCLAFGSHMTPFRQLVWSTLHQHLKPILTSLLEDNQSKLHKDLDEWVTEVAAPAMTTSNKATFTYLATSMSSIMLRNAMQNAMNTSYENMKQAFTQVGISPMTIASLYPLAPKIDPNI